MMDRLIVIDMLGIVGSDAVGRAAKKAPLEVIVRLRLRRCWQ